MESLGCSRRNERRLRITSCNLDPDCRRTRKEGDQLISTWKYTRWITNDDACLNNKGVNHIVSGTVVVNVLRIWRSPTVPECLCSLWIKLKMKYTTTYFSSSRGSVDLKFTSVDIHRGIQAIVTYDWTKRSPCRVRLEAKTRSSHSRINLSWFS